MSPESKFSEWAREIERHVSENRSRWKAPLIVLSITVLILILAALGYCWWLATDPSL